MEIEKTLTVAAPREQVWAMLLDPTVMGGAVPGMKSIEVISPTEYVAVMHQKISFISAKFKLRTRITEQREPEYLCAEGTGEDASVASSLKQRSEVFLTPTADGGTELRIKVSVDLLGRLGTFGLSVMKTKADRLWDEFGANLRARLEGGEGAAAAPAPAVRAPASAPAAKAAPASVIAAPAQAAAVSAPAPAPSMTPPPAALVREAAPVEPRAPAQEAAPASGWWSRLIGGRAGVRAGESQAPQGAPGNGRYIHVEVRQLDKTITVDWPVEAGEQCSEWLRGLMR